MRTSRTVRDHITANVYRKICHFGVSIVRSALRFIVLTICNNFSPSVRAKCALYHIAASRAQKNLKHSEKFVDHGL